MKNQLLPEGFRDSLPELASKEDKVNSTFIKLMQKNGFMLVKPPLLEFESSLFFLLDDNEDANSFRVLDPVSQKMMGIRSDITVQIARISCGSLVELPRPLKVCYSGEILRVKNNSLNLSRQATQIGSEIIGIKKNQCENEIISLMIESLNLLRIKKFFVNFTMPTLISAIADDTGKEVSRDIDIDESAYTQLLPEFENTYFKEVYETLSKKFKLGRVRLLLKEPRSTLSWHKDPECRLHVPIITNKGCSMVIENVAKHLPADGKVWITNNTKYHNFFNGGEQARIHLVACVLESPFKN